MDKNEVNGGKKPSKTIELSKQKDQIVLNPKLEPNNNLNEKVIDLAQRRRRASLMRRVHAKLERKKQITGQRLHTPQQLSQSAERIAKNMLRKRFAGQRGAEYQVLAPSDKIQVDKIVDKKAKMIKAMASRLVPRLRAADVKRLQAKRSGQAVKGISSYMSARPINSGDELAVDDLVKLFEQVNDKVLKVLDEKAFKHGIPKGILEAVFLRGLYESDEQGGFDRVNAFLALGKNALEEDSDVLELAAEAVWDQPNPNKGKGNKMSPADKAEAKRRAKAAGRPYPNLVDNMAAMKESEIEQDSSDVKVIIDRTGKERKVRAHKRVFKVESFKQFAKNYHGCCDDCEGIVEEDFEPTGLEDYEDWGEEDPSLLFEEVKGRKVSLNKPFLTPDGPKKRSVYVKHPSTGNVVKVNFGDPNMTIKKNDPARRRSFRARHNCENPGPKHKARYWSCRAW